MCRKISIWTVCGMGILAGLALPGPAFAQTLEEAMIAAYVGNPTLLAKRAKLRGVDEQLPQALAGWKPTVKLSGDIGRGRYESNAGTPPVQTRTPKNEGLKITQSIYSGGKTIANTSKVENNIASERASLDATEQSILLSVATAYLDVLRDQAVVELNANNEQILKRQLEATQDRFRVGDVTRTDVSQAEARLAKAVAGRVQAEGSLKASRAAFVTVVGDTPSGLQSPSQPTGLPATAEEAVKSATIENPTVQAAVFTEKAAQDNVDVQFADLLPSVSLTGDLARAFRTTSHSSRTETAQIVASLSIPLYQGGEEHARVREAKQVSAQRRREVDQARRDAAETATKAWESLVTAQAQITSYEAQIRASELALEGVKDEASAGTRTVLDVLDAEQELLDARVSMVKARRDWILSGFQMRSATGRLTAKAMGLPVEYYDPEDYSRKAKGRWFGVDVGEDAQK